MPENVNRAVQLEKRRRAAVELLRAGHTVSEVSTVLGVTPSAVSQWKKAYEKGGPQALRARRHPGPHCKISDEQAARLHEILNDGPRASGYRTARWTLAQIASVIERHFGISYHPSGVWHLLRRTGLWESALAPGNVTPHLSPPRSGKRRPAHRTSEVQSPSVPGAADPPDS